MSRHVDDRVWEAYVGGRLDPAGEAAVDGAGRGAVVDRSGTPRGWARVKLAGAARLQVVTAYAT